MRNPKILFAFLLLCFSLLAADGMEQVGGAAHSQGQQTGRGYITHKLESAPGGAYLTVEVVQDRTRSKVELLLALDGTAYNPGTPNWVLTKGSPNPSGYVTRFQFFLDYAKLQALAEKAGVPNPEKRIASGQGLVVIANFPSGHHWGGTDRSGMFTLPKPQSKGATTKAKGKVAETEPVKLPGFGEGPPATSLDVAQPIDKALAEQFTPLEGRGGLEVGGQIRSRVEAEGKFQLDQTEFTRIRQELFEIANTPALAKDIFGAEWSFTVIDRYMKRNRAGKFVVDADGFMVPDPMIDTYYDTDRHDAAKNDVAIRYRWTGGNNTGAWNFKPGDGRRTPDGIVYRVEYGVDTKDNKPESIEVFANSMHPLNPFQLLRKTGATPGSFFNPSIQLVDYRYKFLLSHESGAAIEVSLDKVEAQRMEKTSRAGVVFYQLEMDVEHVATRVKAATAPSAGKKGEPASPYATLHVPKDVREGSPTLETQQTTFELSTEAIRRLRDTVIGDKWRPGAQKYAFAAAALGTIRPANVSRSVKKLGFAKGRCGNLIDKLTS